MCCLPVWVKSKLNEIFRGQTINSITFGILEADS